jgi:hypothetical protein
MANEPIKRKPGRPRIEIDSEQVKALAAKQWKTTEIAAFFGVDRSLIERRFGAELIEGKQSGCAKLRDLQWKRALEGSDRVIIHMSKHYLGQNEKIDLESTVKTSKGIIEKVGEDGVIEGESVLFKLPKDI